MTRNNKWKGIIVMALSMILAGSMAGCGAGSKQPADPSKATEIPDYSSSEKRMNMYAYVGPTPGVYTNAAGQVVNVGDFRTVERYQEYKDCGFDTLLLLGNDGYSGQEFETSDLKKNLDISEEVGLKVLVFDPRIHDLARQPESIIGKGKQFANKEELVKLLEEYIAPYHDHPAFWGMSLIDEPSYENYESMAEVIDALKTIDEDIFPHTVLFPYLPNVTMEQYTGKSFGNVTIDSYKTYVDTYLEKTGNPYVAYDNYPFYEDSFLSSYYRNMQSVVEVAQKHDADVWLAIQSAAWGTCRAVEEDDVRYQCNFALAFGVRNIQYYTYWMFPNGGHSQGIMDHNGEKMIYDEVQRVNQETQAMAKVMMNFDYEKATFLYDKENAISAPTFFGGLKNEDLDGAEVLSVSGATMVSQMKDQEKGLTGYMVFNAADTIDDLSDTVSVKFADYDYVTIYVKGEPKTVGLTDSVLELTLEPGEGIFVIPHK